jgi:hypothetical protein
VQVQVQVQQVQVDVREQQEPIPAGLQLGVQDLGVARDPQVQELGAHLHCTAQHCTARRAVTASAVLCSALHYTAPGQFRGPRAVLSVPAILPPAALF